MHDGPRGCVPGFPGRLDRARRHWFCRAPTETECVLVALALALPLRKPRSAVKVYGYRVTAYA